MTKNQDFNINNYKILLIILGFIIIIMLIIYLSLPRARDLDTYYSNQQYQNYQKLSKKYGDIKADILSEKAWNEECKYKKGYEVPKCLSEKYNYYLDNPDFI